MKTRQKKVETFTGREPDNDYCHPTPTDKKRSNGTYEDYWILTEGEFVQDVKRKYKHARCLTTTTAHKKIAETIARDPGFYNNLFCVECGGHYPLKEFTWNDNGQPLEQ